MSFEKLRICLQFPHILTRVLCASIGGTLYLGRSRLHFDLETRELRST